MPFIQCDFHADTLGFSTSLNVILPRDSSKFIRTDDPGLQGKYPTLYLLHGLSDDQTIWMRRTSIERYADEYGIAVVMPTVHRGFYTDMKAGLTYWKFVSEEVPAFAQASFPLSPLREHNFAAGLSMGGYGAMKLGLGRPDRFAAAASLSGSLDVAGTHPWELMEPDEYVRLFGEREQVSGGADDLFHLAEKAVRSGAPLPKLYQCCGTEDFLYEANLKFLGFARELGFDLTYEEEPGTHEWGYWDRKIQRVLEWLPLPERAGSLEVR
jgi:putative tributyrin esterase